MKQWLEFISIISSFVTLIGFIAIFIKVGKSKGTQEVTIKEMRKDIDENNSNYRTLENKVMAMQIENTKLIATLSSDLGWIKSSLNDIKIEMKSKKEG